MNVLITSASRKVALVRAFQHALAAHGGGRVVAVDTSPLSPALYLADDHELVPRSDAPEFIDAMLALCRRREVRLLVPTRDEELPVFAAARERFAEAGTLVAVASPETVRTCQDKRAFAAFCTANGFSAPRSYEPDEALAGSTWPLFVKPRFGKGGAHTERVDNPADLRRALDRVPELLVQAHVSAPELTVDLFADFGGEVLSAVVRERTRVVAGESYVSRTLDAPHVAAVAARVAHALGLVAHNTLQCFSLDGDAVLILAHVEHLNDIRKYQAWRYQQLYNHTTMRRTRCGDTRGGARTHTHARAAAKAGAMRAPRRCRRSPVPRSRHPRRLLLPPGHDRLVKLAVRPGHL